MASLDIADRAHRVVEAYDRYVLGAIADVLRSIGWEAGRTPRQHVDRFVHLIRLLGSAGPGGARLGRRGLGSPLRSQTWDKETDAAGTASTDCVCAANSGLRAVQVPRES